MSTLNKRSSLVYAGEVGNKDEAESSKKSKTSSCRKEKAPFPEESVEAEAAIANAVLAAVQYSRLRAGTRMELAGSCEPWLLPSLQKHEVAAGEGDPHVLAVIRDRLAKTGGQHAEKAPLALGSSAPHRTVKPSDLVKSHKLREGASVWVRVGMKNIAVEAVLVDESRWTSDGMVLAELEDGGLTVKVDSGDVTLQDTSHYIPQEDINPEVAKSMDCEFGMGMWQLWTKTSHARIDFRNITDISDAIGDVYLELSPLSDFSGANSEQLGTSSDFFYMPNGLEVVRATKQF